MEWSMSFSLEGLVAEGSEKGEVSSLETQWQWGWYLWALADLEGGEMRWKMGCWPWLWMLWLKLQTS